ITKVAPCSAWAGPKSSPRNEWAIMTWSRTSTANIGASFIGPEFWSRIIDDLAEQAALGRKHLRHTRRQVGERDAERQQCVAAGVDQEGERGGEPAPVRPAPTVRGRDLAHLARHALQPAAAGGPADRDR